MCGNRLKCPALETGTVDFKSPQIEKNAVKWTMNIIFVFSKYCKFFVVVAKKYIIA